VEGLVVDEGITMAHLRGAITAFANGMSARGLRTRFRPYFFPFNGSRPPRWTWSAFGAAAASGRARRRAVPHVPGPRDGFELGGCGMVNPRVLVACGVDPSATALGGFGLGVERTLMFRHGVRTMPRHGRRVTCASPAPSDGDLMRVRFRAAEYVELPANATARDIAGRPSRRARGGEPSTRSART